MQIFVALLPDYRDGFASSQFLLAIAETLDLLAILDALKSSKASLNNDFAMYKRYAMEESVCYIMVLLHHGVCSVVANLKNLTQSIDDETTENHNVYLFLSSQNAFTTKLKEKLVSCAGFEELLVDMVNLCATNIENQSYVTPDSKHMLIKVTNALWLEVRL